MRSACVIATSYVALLAAAPGAWAAPPARIPLTGVLQDNAGEVVTTGVFVGLHLGEIWYFWPAALSVTAVASVALVLRLRTQAMGAPIALHLAFNAVLAVLVCFRG